MTVPASEPALAFLELPADEVHADALTPGTQVSIERRGNDDDGIALAPVPLDALDRRFADLALDSQ